MCNRTITYRFISLSEIQRNRIQQYKNKVNILCLIKKLLKTLYVCFFVSVLLSFSHFWGCFIIIPKNLVLRKLFSKQAKLNWISNTLKRRLLCELQCVQSFIDILYYINQEQGLLLHLQTYIRRWRNCSIIRLLLHITQIQTHYFLLQPTDKITKM